MPRGRLPKPLALTVLEGNRSHRRARSPGPQYASLPYDAPDWLPAEGRREWRRLMTIFDRYPGLVQTPDRQALIALCLEWDRYLLASKDIAARGLIVDGKSRGESSRIKNPSAQVARDSLLALQQLWARFGLTPLDRQRLEMPSRETEDGSGIEQYLTGYKDRRP